MHRNISSAGLARRALFAVALVGGMPTWAMADESVSGQWQANLGHGVLIAMDVLADGHWTSQTVQQNKVVAEMAGTYDQKKSNATSGTIVFNPVNSKTTQEHGAAAVETDHYTIESGGKVLRLVSSKKDVMVFHRQ